MTSCALLFLLAGCTYKVPVTTEHKIKINRDLLGPWEAKAFDDATYTNKTDSAQELRELTDALTNSIIALTVLEFDDTQYLVQYKFCSSPTNNTATVFFRAYPVQIGGLLALQTKAIGSPEGPLIRSDCWGSVSVWQARPYNLILYSVTNDVLEFRRLNEELISPEIDDCAALRKAIIKNLKNPKLFSDPVVCRRPGSFYTMVHRIQQAYEKNGRVEVLMDACKKLIEKHKAHAKDKDDPFEVSGNELGDAWPIIQKSWKVHSIKIWYWRMGVSPAVEILLKDQPAGITISLEPEPKPGLKPDEPVEGLMKRWAPGAYIHYSERIYRHYNPVETP